MSSLQTRNRSLSSEGAKTSTHCGLVTLGHAVYHPPMYVYAKYCPVAAATNVIGDFWTPLIVRELLYGTGGFNQLARNVPGISRTVLSMRLHSLEAAEIVQRDSAQRGKAATYTLTPAGQALRPVIEALNQWGTAWGAPSAEDEGVDPLVAICMLKSRIQPASPTTRAVIEVTVGSGPGTKAWVVCERNQVSMCFDPPGFEVDVFVATDASTLYQIWLGHLAVRDAIGTGLLALDGNQSLVREFPRWFELPLRH